MKRLLLQSLSITAFLFFLASCQQPSIEPTKDLKPTISEQQPPAEASAAVKELSIWSKVVNWFI